MSADRQFIVPHASMAPVDWPPQPPPLLLLLLLLLSVARPAPDDEKTSEERHRGAIHAFKR